MSVFVMFNFSHFGGLKRKLCTRKKKKTFWPKTSSKVDG